MVPLRIETLDPSTWDAFATLVEADGGVWGGCWCMAFHSEGVGRHTTAAQSPHRRSGVADAALAGALRLISDAGGGRVEAITEDTAGRVVQGRFLFSATLDLVQAYGFTSDRQVDRHSWLVSRVVAPG